MKYRLATIIFLLSSSLFIYHAYLQKSDSSVPSPAGESLTHNTSLSKEISVRKNETKMDIPSPSDLKESKNSPQEKWERINRKWKNEVENILNSANHVKGKQTRIRILEEWTNDPDQRFFLRHILLDSAVDVDSSTLASFRYFAVQALALAAHQGQPEPLRHMLQDFVTDPERQKYRATHKSHRQDYADMFAEYLRSFPKENLHSLENILEILQSIHIEKINSPELKEIIDDELFLVLYPIHGKKEASKKIDVLYSLL